MDCRLKWVAVQLTFALSPGFINAELLRQFVGSTMVRRWSVIRSLSTTGVGRDVTVPSSTKSPK